MYRYFTDNNPKQPMLWRGNDVHAEYLTFDLDWCDSAFRNLDDLLEGVEKEAVEECSASRAIEIIEMYSC